MAELLAHLQALTKGMWRYRWHGVAAAWAAAVLGAVVTWRIPSQYEASARIYVDTQSILKPLMAGLTVQPNIDQQVTMLSRTLISRPNVEKLVQMADLDLASHNKAQQEATVDRLMQTLKIQGTGRDNLYTLSYRDAEPERALRAVRSLVSIFVESGLGASRKDNDSAKTFIAEQIKAYRSKLEEAEARLKEFRLRNLDVEYGEGRDAAARLAEASTALDGAKLELSEAVNARDAARAQLEAERRQGASLSTQSLLQESALSVSTPETDARIEALRKGLDQLLQRYTDNHPDVVTTRKLLKDLEEHKRKEVAELRKAAAAAPAVAAAAGTSPAALELNKLLAASEVQVAALRARVGEYSARHQKAMAALKVAPQLEAEAARLNRDYAIHKKNYEDLVARREAAAMSGELDVASGVADFRLIDPPRTTPQPVWPNRLLLLALSLVLALATGVGTVLGLSQVRPVFHRTADLRARFAEVPVLGVVSRTLGAEDLRRRRVDLLRFSAASGSLVLLFVAGLVVMSIVGGPLS
jgi:polysaccharide chain length determinant protein (PEP-CTERM system associated)